MKKQYFHHGVICTMDGSQPFVSSLLVEGAFIRYLGPLDEALLTAEDIEPIDLAGQFVLPGFIDAHAHPLDGQLWAGPGDASACQSKEALIEHMKHLAAVTPVDEWVFVSGANLAWFGDYPTRQQLDEWVPDRPLLVVNYDVHSASLNSLGLIKAGIRLDAADPGGGRYERDDAQQLTGVVHETGLYRILPQLPLMQPDRFPVAIRQVNKMAHALGITGWFEARVDHAMLQAYHAAEQSGDLQVHVSAGLLAVNHYSLVEQVRQFTAWRQQYEGDLLKIHTIKVFVDGVMESGTAHLVAPYQGTETVGESHWQPSQLAEICRLADEAGFDLHFHTLGDGAVRCVLDALSYVQASTKDRQRRIQLAHLQLVDKADHARFYELGAIASVQGYWAAASGEQKQLYRELLGEDRANACYPLRSLQNAGAILAGGSDWPITTMNPLAIMQHALTRQLDESDEPWNASERLDLASLLSMHTRQAAYALRFDDQCGYLSVGKEASFIILDQHPFKVNPHQLREVKVQQTFFRGKCVFNQMKEQTHE